MMGLGLQSDAPVLHALAFVEAAPRLLAILGRTKISGDEGGRSPLAPSNVNAGHNHEKANNDDDWPYKLPPPPRLNQRVRAPTTSAPSSLLRVSVIFEPKTSRKSSNPIHLPLLRVLGLLFGKWGCWLPWGITRHLLAGTYVVGWSAVWLVVWAGWPRALPSAATAATANAALSSCEDNNCECC
jgi:hypothetical protein